MSASVVLVVYAAAVALAIVLLYKFEFVAWYWHTIALGVAVLLGYLPPPDGFAGPVADVVTGFTIIFLLFWGLGGLLLLMAPHRHKHA